ncbi:MAG TPA: ABC transporter permease subunit [Thermoflexales bacterium]|jgi:arabinogalactan oligomer/maltooligosaccharide transport system permease protein|nr:ABC transporter permease subunit [Thermoflexales bacterium]
MVTTTSNPVKRLLRMNTSNEKGGRALSLGRQLFLQLLCILIGLTVMFPIMYIITLSLSSSDSRPSALNLIPTEFSMVGFQKVLDQPTANPVTFAELLRNSLALSLGVASAALLIAVSAAYAFARFKFAGRQFLMMAVFFVILMPGVGLSLPLYLLFNGVSIVDPESGRVVFNLRNSLVGVGVAMISGALPFAIWNLKGYLDTIPKELEEAATIDGASFNRIFFQIVIPLAAPALAVTFFLSFMGNWQEFALSWLFLSNPGDYTLAMTLYNMTGQYATAIPWNRFSAMAIIVAAPVALIYIALQKQIVGGLTLGGVKG